MSSQVASDQQDQRLLYRLLELLGLSTLAFVQPVFSLIDSAPEFFSARKTPAAAVVAFAVAITLVLPLAVLVLEWIAQRAREGWGARVHDGARVLFLSMLVLGILNQLTLQATRASGLVVSGWLLIAVALLCGLGVLALLRRSQVSRLFVRFLAVAAPIALIAFLGSVPLRSTAASGPTQARHPIPVVMVVMDEFPTASLLSSGDRIDGRRLPNFARLAREGTFYPHATTVADQTTAAVPSILSGRRSSLHVRAPGVSSWPRNLFTLLPRRYALHVREPITRLCPPQQCPSESRSTADAVSALASETSNLAYLSIAPKDMAARAPLIGGSDVRDPGHEFAQFVAKIRPERRPTLDFLHVLAPHRPWGRLPSGRSYPVGPDDGGVPQSVRQTLKLPDDPQVALRLWRAHLLQVGFADRLLGRVMARLKRTGMYDRSLLVVVSDHGVSFRPGSAMRDVTPENVGNIAPVPLFIKQPHGRDRGTDSAPAETIDLLPTILDVIGARAPPGLEGVSLLHHVPPNRPVRVLSTKATYVTTSLAEILRGRARSLRVQRSQVIDSPQWRQRCRLAHSGC